MRAALTVAPLALLLIAGAAGCGDKGGGAAPSGGGGATIDSGDTAGPGGGDSGDGEPAGTGGDTSGDTGCEALSWYADADGDGYGDPASVTESCERPEGAVGNDRDCDDDDPMTWPGADERCDGEDNSCDGAIDEGLAIVPWWPDSDADGYGDIDGAAVEDCGPPEGYTDNAADCDDADAGAVPAFVDAAASGGGDGRPAAPYNSIQRAIHAGEVCIQVAAGDYDPITLGDGTVRVVGAGPELTRIDGGGASDAGACVDASGVELTLEAMTLTGCAGRASEYSCSGHDACYIHYGGGLYVEDAAVALRGVVLRDNTIPYGTYTEAAGAVYRYGYGGGIASFSGAVSLEDVTLQGNFALEGAAVYGTYGSLAMTRVSVVENTAYYGVVYAYSVDITASALIVASNSSGYGSLYLSYSVADIAHATFAGNHDYAGIFSVDIYAANTKLALTDSILSYNTNYGILDDSGSAVADYVDLYGAGVADVYTGSSLAGSNQISVDPRFVDFTDNGIDDDDLRLDPSSGCVDVGSPDHTDLDGSPTDLGAYGGPDGAW